MIKYLLLQKNLKYDGCQCGLALMFYKYFDKKTSGGTVKNENISNKELVEELHKLIIRNCNKRKVQSSLRGNIWGADRSDMQLISKLSKGFRFLLCVIYIYSKYAWVISLKHKVLQLLMLFKKF